jgi:hypothetical protein
MRSMVASLGVRSVLVWLIASVALAVAASPALAEPMFAVTGGAPPQLWSFDSATPEAATSKPIGGLQLNESVLGLDARPATGQLYALGSTSRLYTINPATAAATQVGTGTFSTPIVGADFGFDFDPTADLVRVVSTSGQNMRLSPVTGNVADVDTNLAYAASDPHFGAPPNVDAAAYTNNFPGATSTTLYEIDLALDNLVRQGSVGGSPVSATTGQLFTIGSFSPFATSSPTALDISSAGIAYASLRPAPSSDLYTVNLATAGAPTGVGPIGPEGLTITGLAVGLPGPALTPASANFGQEQVDDTTAPTTFTVTNNGSAPVHVGGVSVTGAFHSPSNNCVGTTLAPGASCPIQVVFSPRRLGTHNGTLTFHDNAAGTPPTASLTGDGVSPITLTPATGQFPAQAVGTTSAPIQFTLSNLSDAPVGITSILTTAQFPHSQTCGSVLGPLASCSIQVSFSPSSTGPMAGGLTVRSNAPTTETLHSTLAGSGFVPPLTVTVRTASSRKMARALRNGIVARVGCSKACRASAQLVLRGALPRARSAAVVVGRGSTSLTGQGSKRLTARFTAAARRALPRRKRARLSLRVSFTASPNQSARVRKSILLRR